MPLLILYSTIYYFFIVPAIAVVLWILIKMKETKNRNQITLGLIFFIPVLVRLPYILSNSEMDVDESGIIGQAISLKNGLLVWRDLNLSTAGPLNTYTYYIFCRLFNIPFDYVSVHILALILDYLMLFFLFKAGQKQFGFRESLLALLVVVAALHLPPNTNSYSAYLTDRSPLFNALDYGNFRHELFNYTSEKLSMVIIAFMLYLVAGITPGKEISPARLYLVGFLAGLAPFTKPQCVLITTFISLFAFYLAYKLKTNTLVKNAAAYLSGAFSFPLLILLYLYWADGWSIFNSQLKLMQGYPGLVEGLFAYAVQFFKSVGFTSIFFILFILFLINYSKNLAANSDFFWFLVGLSIISVYSICKPGRFYGHYFQYLLPLIFYFSIYSVNNKTYKVNTAIILLLLMAYIGLDGAHRRLNSSQSIEASINPKKDTLSCLINKHKKASDKLAIWGFAPNYFVETQLPQATSQNHVPYIVKGKYSKLFQQEYINEIIKNKPAFFLDASGYSQLMIKQKFEEILPTLTPFINQNYSFIKIYQGSRLFIRKDRLKQNHI